LESILDAEEGVIRRYKEYKADFDKLNTKEIKELFKDIDSVKAKIVVLQKLKDNTEEWLGSLEDINKTDILEGIDDIVSNYSEVIKTWWEEGKPKYEERKSAVIQDIGKGINKLSKIKEELDSEITKLKEEQGEKERKLREEVGEEATTQVAAELRRRAAERLEKVQTLRRDYMEKWQEFSGLLKEWKKNTKGISEVQDQISEKRATRKEEIEADLNKFSSPEMKISLRFAKGSDRQRFVAYLYDCGILNKAAHGNWRQNIWPQRISLACTPVQLAASILGNDPQKVTKSYIVKGQECGVDQSMAETLVYSLYPFSDDKDAELPIVDSSRLKNIMKIAEVEWEDLEGILLNDKPVEKCSPGQRSSAMLPLIALVEDMPLIIDQPEDNLDNRLIGRMLVDILTGLKEHRQIIVATHNPNIVVSGDAEQVIVLDAISDTKGKLTCSGSIDKEEIVKSVIELMEGGKEAFITRYKRYGIDQTVT
jgi:hypothetical protein